MQGYRAAAVALSVVGWAARLSAIAMCVLTVVLCFSGVASTLNLVGFIVDLSRALPGAIAGYGVITTPFGGVFRLDYAIVAAVLFLIDFACMRAAFRLRRMR